MVWSSLITSGHTAKLGIGGFLAKMKWQINWDLYSTGLARCKKGAATMVIWWHISISSLSLKEKGKKNELWAVNMVPLVPFQSIWSKIKQAICY